jgi:hypothetical protein
VQCWMHVCIADANPGKESFDFLRTSIEKIIKVAYHAYTHACTYAHAIAHTRSVTCVLSSHMKQKKKSKEENLKLSGLLIAVEPAHNIVARHSAIRLAEKYGLVYREIRISRMPLSLHALASICF